MTHGLKMFDCGECGSRVRTVTGVGRTYEYRPGIKLPIPEAFPTNVCDECGELYLTAEEAEQLEQALEPAFAEYCNDLVDTACTRAGVTIRDLEQAAGVTHTYLSKVKNGKQASVSLLRLLQAFARFPDEVHRHLAGTDYRDELEGDLDFDRWQRLPTVSVNIAESTASLDALGINFSFEDRLPEAGVATGLAVHRPRRTHDWGDNDNCIATPEADSTAMLDVA